MLEQRFFYLFFKYRIKVMGICFDYLLDQSWPWMALSVQNLILGNQMGQMVAIEMEGLVIGLNVRWQLTLFIALSIYNKVIIIFYQCLCSTSSRISIATLWTIASTLGSGSDQDNLAQSWPRFRAKSGRSTTAASSRDKYNHYIERLEEKIAILQEQAREYGQIMNIHQSIEQQLRKNKKEKPEVKKKVLEEYKAAIMAKKSKKIMERFQELEFERGMLDGNAKQKAEVLYRRKDHINQEVMNQNPQRKSSQNKTEQSRARNSAFGKYRSQQKYRSQPDPLPNIKSVKLPAISQSMNFSNDMPSVQAVKFRPSGRSLVF